MCGAEARREKDAEHWIHSVDFPGILFRVATNFVYSSSFELPDGASGTAAKEARAVKPLRLY
jgi:hypothetical protein